jgi:hypothetical protein
MIRERKGEPCAFEQSSCHLQAGLVVHEMIFDESRYEVIAVVVSLMTPQGQRLSDFLACLFEDMRMQLFGQEFVIQSLIDEYAFREGRPSVTSH